MKGTDEMKESEAMEAEAVKVGVEDRFHYEVADGCTGCGACVRACPAGAAGIENGRARIDPAKCIDCGTCAVACPAGAARSPRTVRKAPPLGGRLYFNPGCAMNLYRPGLAGRMLELLRSGLGDVEMHEVCCRHEPRLAPGATIINNCAGCDRRFRSLYAGVRTVSCWEALDGIEGLALPDYAGLTASVHDSCGYRHRPQVHRAVRSLLRKMNVAIVEARFSGADSVCCGDNLYGLVPDAEVERRIRLRCEQMPCRDVVVTCIGCVRAMAAGGRTPRYLPDLLFGERPPPVADTLGEYHARLADYIRAH